jgi:hypothetical protein
VVTHADITRHFLFDGQSAIISLTAAPME